MEIYIITTKSGEKYNCLSNEAVIDEMIKLTEKGKRPELYKAPYKYTEEGVEIPEKYKVKI